MRTILAGRLAYRELGRGRPDRAHLSIALGVWKMDVPLVGMHPGAPQALRFRDPKSRQEPASPALMPYPQSHEPLAVSLSGRTDGVEIFRRLANMTPQPALRARRPIPDPEPGDRDEPPAFEAIGW